MPLQEEIKSALLVALKAKDAFKVQTLRLLVSALKNQQINLHKEALEDAEVLKVIKTEAKKRQDSITAYTNGGRPELAAQEQAELALLQVYLPKELTLEEIRAKAIAVKEATGLNQFGPLMGKVMAELGPLANGKMVQQVIKELLN